MEIIQWVLLILLALFIINRFVIVKGVPDITVEEAKAKIKDKNIQFIDVRTVSEYKAGHRRPFKNIPLNNLLNQLDKLDKNKEIIIICESGMRSARATRMLQRNGFDKVLNVKGGLKNWR